jgi:hypothetical protein
MPDSDFEARLERLFDQPPAFSDNEAFARLVEARLDRGWGLRQGLIGAAGLAGGIVAAVQLLGSGALPRFEAVTAQSAQALTGALRGGLPMGGEAMWMAAALGVMALAFALTRASQEF